MSNLFKIQYQTAKNIIERLENDVKMRELSNNNKDLQEHYSKSIISLIEYLSIIVGIDCKIYLDGTICKPAEVWSGQMREYFDKYEKELLENNLIEYGDTLTEEQKLAYYHEQEMQIRMNEYFFNQ